MDGLRQKLESQGLVNVNYMVVNHQGKQAQRLHDMLSRRLSSSITLHKQEDDQPDVWHALNGDKDDFFIYDRCGRLTNHISLPYSIIGQGHIEDAIKQTYCKRPCGDCTHESVDLPAVCNTPVESKPEGEGRAAVEETEPGRGHGHHHGEQHVAGHTHSQGHGHHHGDHHGAGHAHGQNHHGNCDQRQGHDQRGQHCVEDFGLDLGQLDLGQLQMGQKAMHLGQMPQEAQAAAVMQRP